MFRRRWSGLPADPVFPSDLTELGYFINQEDEIRCINEPDYYYNYFINKNQRWNDRKRFAMNQAVQKVIQPRFKALGLERLCLPLGSSAGESHVSILASDSLSTHSRVVLVFGQSMQDHAVIAHRVINGKGGIDRGSMVSLVRKLVRQPCSSTDSGPPGIILANTGELWWWPEGKRSLSPWMRHAVPMASAVHWGRYYDPTNAVPGNRTPAEHVKTIFEEVVPKMVSKTAILDVVAVGDAADDVEAYLNDDEVWRNLGGRMHAMVVLGNFFRLVDVKCEAFKTFLKDRTRSYVLDNAPLGTLVAGPYGKGDADARTYNAHGCPVYSAGNAKVTEMILVDACPDVLDYLEQAAMDPDFRNPNVQTTEGDHASNAIAGSNGAQIELTATHWAEQGWY